MSEFCLDNAHRHWLAVMRATNTTLEEMQVLARSFGWSEEDIELVSSRVLNALKRTVQF